MDRMGVDRYIAKRGFFYPADPESVRLVREAGGLSKLTQAQRAEVRMKSVAIGEDCSDMPSESLALRLSRGEVERIAGADVASAAAPRTAKAKKGAR